MAQCDLRCILLPPFKTNSWVHEHVRDLLGGLASSYPLSSFACCSDDSLFGGRRGRSHDDRSAGCDAELDQRDAGHALSGGGADAAVQGGGPVLRWIEP